MRIKFLSTVVAAVAVLAVGTASASATTIQVNGSTIANNTSITATNSTPVVLTAGFGTVTCNSSSLVQAIDSDGSVDVGDVSSASYTSCSAKVFGSNTSATVTAQNVSSSSGAITDVAGTTDDSIAVNGTTTQIALGTGCTIVVTGSINGVFDNTVSVARFANQTGLSVASRNSAFLCGGINVGDPANFTGDYDVATTSGGDPIEVA